MIRIGNAIINEQEIAAAYPDKPDTGLCWVILKCGRGFWVRATMEQIARALQPVFGEIISSKVASEIEVLERLTADGFRFLHRDADGLLYADECEPEKFGVSWTPSKGRLAGICSDLFDGVVEWQDETAAEISVLLEDMTMHPEKYEE